MTDPYMIRCRCGKLLSRAVYEFEVHCAYCGKAWFASPSFLDSDGYQAIRVGPMERHDRNNNQCPLNDPETACNPALAGLSCTCEAGDFA